MMKNIGLVKKINLAVLLICCILTVALCPPKHLYFDEPFQIMESKGITGSNINEYTAQNPITSATLAKANTFHNTFIFSDSIQYDLLYYMARIFGNNLNTYVYFSLFWAILTLIAFYYLCRLIVGDNLFTALCIILLFTNLSFLTQAYNIRHYIMALFFTVLSAIFFFKYLFENKSFKNLLALGMCCLICTVTHYYTVYIIMVYVLAILLQEKLAFFSWKNILALAIPAACLGAYFTVHPTPFQSQNHYQQYVTAAASDINSNTNLGNQLSLFMKSVAVNFQVYYPLLKDTLIIRAGSVLLVIAAYIYGVIKLTPGAAAKKKFNLVFVMGIISCFFLTVIAIKSKNNMQFSYRYFLFSIPFCCLFTALFLKQLFNTATPTAVKMVLSLLLVTTGFYKFIVSHTRANSWLECNHLLVIDKIKKNGIHKITVPQKVDAVFINCLLPEHYDIDYYIDPTTDSATLYTANTAEKIHLVQNALIVTF